MTGFEPATFGLIEVTLVFTTGETCIVATPPQFLLALSKWSVPPVRRFQDLFRSPAPTASPETPPSSLRHAHPPRTPAPQPPKLPGRIGDTTRPSADQSLF